MDTLISLNHLRLACRRGMWELDLFFEPFLDGPYQTLSKQEQQNFIELLGCDDPDLFSWFMEETRPKNNQWLSLIYKIKAYAKERLH